MYAALAYPIDGVSDWDIILSKMNDPVTSYLAQLERDHIANNWARHYGVAVSVSLIVDCPLSASHVVQNVVHKAYCSPQLDGMAVAHCAFAQPTR